jgi:hypothetical protein
MSDRDLRRAEMLVCFRGSFVPSSRLPGPTGDSLTWNSIQRPTDPGLCIIRDCGRRATHDGLCSSHDRHYRPRCPGCGEPLTTDGQYRRWVCGRCYHRAGAPRRRAWALRAVTAEAERS